jgi:hypothetical protein
VRQVGHLSGLFHVFFDLGQVRRQRSARTAVEHSRASWVNRIREALTFLEGVNVITFTRVSWNLVDFCVAVLRH